MHHKGGGRAKCTFLAAVAFSKRSSRAFSFCFLFLRRVSGTSMSCRKPVSDVAGNTVDGQASHRDGRDTMLIDFSW